MHIDTMCVSMFACNKVQLVCIFVKSNKEGKTYPTVDLLIFG